MKRSTFAFLLTTAVGAAANPGGCGQYGGCTGYSTWKTTTPVVTYYTTTYQSVCTTQKTYQPPPKVYTTTVTTTYTKPGETKKYTSYVPYPVTETLPASTLTEMTTYTTEATDVKSITIYKTNTVTDTYVITSNSTITVPRTIPVPTTVQELTTLHDTQNYPVPTTYVLSTTVTEEGTNYVSSFTVTDTTTQVEISQVTTEIPVPTTVLQTVENYSVATRNGTTETVTSIEGIVSFVTQPAQTVVDYSTVVRNGTTEIVTSTKEVTQIMTQPAQTVVNYSTITRDGTKEIVTFPEDVTQMITQPAQTVEATRIQTVTASGTISLATVVDTKTLNGATEIFVSTKEFTLVTARPAKTVGVTWISTMSASGTISLVTIVDTVSLPGTTVERTLPASTITLQVPTTISSLYTVFQSGVTSISTTTQVSTIPQVTVISIQPGRTITIHDSTITVPGEPLPAETVPLPGTTLLRTLPGTTVVDQLPAETIFYTATFHDTVYMTVTQPPITITEAPPMPTRTCNGRGYFSQSDGADCGGDDCYLNFALDTYVHWNVTGTYPPLRTRVVFENPSASATCITTICNTIAFSQYYYRSQTDCSRPPCPSNYVNSECQLVVGPIVLPNGDRTAVTQDGTAGWNLNLGMTGTAYNIPTCNAGNPQCAEPTRTTRTTPLIYTGEVITITPTNNVTYATPTEWLLPDLPGYFPQGDAFGQCGTVLFQDPTTPEAPMLHRPKLHKRILQKRVPYIGETTWPATNGLLAATTFTATPEMAQLASSPASSTEQPAVASPPGTSTEAVQASAPSTSGPPIDSAPSQNASPAEPSSSTQAAVGLPSSAAEQSTPNARFSEESVYTTIVPESTLIVTNPNDASGGVISTSIIPGTTRTLTGSASASTSSTQNGSIGSSTETGTSLTTGTDGRVTAYVTVFYSMIPGPNGTSSSAPATTQTGVGSNVKFSRMFLAFLVAMIAVFAL